MIAVICGATGLVGNALLLNLIEDEDFHQIKVVGRTPSSHKHSKVINVMLKSLDELPARKSELKGDVYFCCLGTTIKKAGNKENFRLVDYKGVLDFAQVAYEHKGKNFVIVSAMGANSKSKFFYNRVKGEVENMLQAFGFKRLVIFRPSLLIGDRTEYRAFELIAIRFVKVLEHILSKKLVLKMGTRVETLARAMLREGKIVNGPHLIVEAENISD